MKERKKIAVVIPRVDHRRLIRYKRPSGPATLPITIVKPRLTIVCGTVANNQINKMPNTTWFGTKNGAKPVSA